MDSFDKETGQVFKETMMKNMKQVPWELRSHSDQLEGEPHVPAQEGPKSLERLALETLVQNANSLLPETLKNLPEPIATRIWIAIRREWKESFHIWTVFISAGFKGQNFKHRLVINYWRRGSLPDVFSKLSSAGCPWVVDLALVNVVVSAADLKEVSRVASLRTLLVGYLYVQHSKDFDDRIVQVWSDRAVHGGAFAKLELLAFVNTPQITSSVFRHLAKFPTTIGFSAYDTGITCKRSEYEEAERYGWSRNRAAPGMYGLSSRGTVSSGLGNFRDFLGRQRAKLASKSNSPILDAHIGTISSATLKIKKDLLLCFERTDTQPIEKSDESIATAASSSKRRKLNEAKDASFASMLTAG